MRLRRETPSDIDAVRRLIGRAFPSDPVTGAPVDGEPVEVSLLDRLRASDSWMPPLSWVAAEGDDIVGYAVCTRAHVACSQVVGLGPIAVQPELQRTGIGSALVHVVLGATDALDVPLVGLLGDPYYYGRFGFRPSSELAVMPPDPGWGQHFQVRALAAHRGGLEGTFTYAPDFGDLGGRLGLPTTDLVRWLRQDAARDTAAS